MNWRDLDLPDGHPGSVENATKILENKPAHWLAWYDGRVPSVDAAPGDFVPAALTPDQLREITALIHIENELIDEACGRVLRRVAERGWADRTDVVYTTDHGELQGDFGLLYKGPFHVESLMRLPLIWRPAPAYAGTPAVVADPVSQIDLAPTFCQIAGITSPDWMQGRPLPTAPDPTRQRALCEWDSQLDNGYHLRSIYRDGWLCTVYEPSTPGVGLPSREIYAAHGVTRDVPPIVYGGVEGELYDLRADSRQWHNRWDDPACAALRGDLVADLYDHLPAPRRPALRVESRA